MTRRTSGGSEFLSFGDGCVDPAEVLHGEIYASCAVDMAETSRMFGESVDASQATLESFILPGTVKAKIDAMTSMLTLSKGTSGTLRTLRVSAWLSVLLRCSGRLSCGRTGCLLATLCPCRVASNALLHFF